MKILFILFYTFFRFYVVTGQQPFSKLLFFILSIVFFLLYIVPELELILLVLLWAATAIILLQI